MLESCTTRLLGARKMAGKKVGTRTALLTFVPARQDLGTAFRFKRKSPLIVLGLLLSQLMRWRKLFPRLEQRFCSAGAGLLCHSDSYRRHPAPACPLSGASHHKAGCAIPSVVCSVSLPGTESSIPDNIQELWPPLSAISWRHVGSWRPNNGQNFSSSFQPMQRVLRLVPT